MENRQSHAGRPASWITVGIVVAGFIIGSIGLIAGPVWSMFWAGVAITLAGGLALLAFGAFSDVVLDESEQPTSRPTRRDANHFPHG